MFQREAFFYIQNFKFLQITKQNLIAKYVSNSNINKFFIVMIPVSDNNKLLSKTCIITLKIYCLFKITLNIIPKLLTITIRYKHF